MLNPLIKGILLLSSSGLVIAQQNTNNNISPSENENVELKKVKHEIAVLKSVELEKYCGKYVPSHHAHGIHDNHWGDCAWRIENDKNKRFFYHEK